MRRLALPSKRCTRPNQNRLLRLPLSSPGIFRKGENAAGWVPLAKKGTLANNADWLYPHDQWTRRHPIFDGLPSGGLMDYTFYREIIPDTAWVGQDPPAEVVAGAINTSIDYSAGLLVSVHSLGTGRFILNTLHIRENLGQNPAAFMSPGQQLDIPGKPGTGVKLPSGSRR